MYRSPRHHVTGSILILTISTLPSPTPAKPYEEAAPLLSAIPADVFFCVTGRHNPEREFLVEYWEDVNVAFHESGILNDLMEIAFAELSEDQRANVDRLKTRFTKLISAIDWRTMGKGETVFAERMGAPKKLGGGMMFMMPDMVFLARGNANSGEANFEGLSALMHAAVEEINGAAGKEVVTVVPSAVHDARILSLRAAGDAGKKVPLSLAIAVRKDILAIAMGDQLLADAIALLAGESSSQPITATTRFREAFAKLPAAEDEQTFIDVQALLNPLRGLADFTLEEVAADAKAKDSVKNAYRNDEANAIANQALEAYRAKDYQKALDLTKKAHQVDPSDSRLMFNIACFSALLGEEDEALSWLDRAVEAGFHAPNKIRGDDDLDSVRTTAQFKAVLAKAEKLITDNDEGTAKVERVQRIINRMMGIPGMFDYVASVKYTDGHSVHHEDVVALVPDASKNPFYVVFGKRQPAKVFDRFVPKEATSFSVSGGIDLLALYKFLEDTVRDLGPDGEKALAKWEQIQKENNFDVRKDALGWIQGDTVTVSLPQAMGEASVFLLRVTDDETAHAKLKAALDGIATGMREIAKHNPMLAAFAPQVSPTTDPRLPGFQNVMIAMNPFVCGVAEGHLIIGTSAEAVATCLATAKGEHPSIRSNETFMDEGIVPKGAFRAVSFVDERNFGRNLATGVGMASLSGGMMAAMIPDAKTQRIMTKLLGMLGKLSPVLGKLDFYKSSATAVTFDGNRWHSHGVTNYVSPTERAAKAQHAKAEH